MSPQKKKPEFTREQATIIYFKAKALYGNPYADSDIDQNDAIRILLEALTAGETTEKELMQAAMDQRAAIDKHMFSNRFAGMVKNRYWMLNSGLGVMVIAPHFTLKDLRDED